MKNFIEKGGRLVWTNGTGNAVASGDLVVVGALLCVACVDIANGATGALATEGVFELPKVAGAGHAMAQGESINYDASTGKLDNKDLVLAAGDISGNAVVWKAALAADATVQVYLPGNPGVIKA